MEAISCVLSPWSQQYALYATTPVFAGPALPGNGFWLASLLTLLSLTSLGLTRENRYSSEIVWLEKLWILFKPLP